MPRSEKAAQFLKCSKTARRWRINRPRLPRRKKGDSCPDEAVAEKDFTEAELTGAEPGAAPPLPTPITPEVTPASEVPEKEAEVEPGKEPAAPTPPAPKDTRTVPYAALHEERIARQRLTAQIEELRKQIPTEPVKTAAELILEDPENAVKTLEEKIAYLQTEMDRRDMEREIRTAVPDFFEKAVAMEDMLREQGFSDEGIKTMIASSGKDAPILFKVLSKLVSAPNEEALRTKLTAELTPKITEEITRSLMAKFKIVEPGVDVNKLPGTPPDGKLKIGSETELAQLTPDQHEKWLRGEL